jgi:pyrimidine-nucleoside phosphorylase
VLGGAAATDGEARAAAASGLRRGVGADKLGEIVAAQGGDPSPIDEPDLLPAAPIIVEVRAPHSGFITDIEPMALALAANRLGAGRARKGDPIDHAVGFEVVRTLGERVSQGAVLARVHARSEAQAQDAGAIVRAAVSVGDVAPQTRGIVLGRFSTQD